MIVLGVSRLPLSCADTAQLAIEAALAIEALREAAELLEGVPATFADVAGAYRAWALAHPHLHRLMNNQPLPRGELPPGLEERAGAPLVQACAGDWDLARAAWATINGLVDLELARRLPPGTDITAAYGAAARAYDTPRMVAPGARWKAKVVSGTTRSSR